MAAEIKCPNCGHEFEPNEAIREEVEKELRVKVSEWQKQKEQQFDQKLQQEKTQIRQAVEVELRKSISSDYETTIRHLQETKKENEEKLRISREKELEYLQKEAALKTKEAELEISVQKKLQEERSKLSEELAKIEQQKFAAKDSEYQLKLKEMEKKLDDQTKLADEMRRRAEQGSMQLQGESQELLLEETLKSSFPFDVIQEIGKGKRGADCLQVIRNSFGQECGKIYFESKRAENFGGDWIEKLKSDMRKIGADVAVIVTKTMPKGMEKYGEKDGVWVCSLNEVVALTNVLRFGIIKVFNATKSQENKGDKMHLLYGYLTSNEFSEQWKAIREGFLSMKISIEKERDAMEKIWKSREKQLEKVLINAAHIKGSIEGIAGQDSIDFNLLPDIETDTLPPG